MAKPRIYEAEQTRVGLYQRERSGRRGIAVGFVDDHGREFTFALGTTLAVKLLSDLNKAAQEVGVPN